METGGEPPRQDPATNSENEYATTAYARALVGGTAPNGAPWLPAGSFFINHIPEQPIGTNKELDEPYL